MVESILLKNKNLMNNEIEQDIKTAKFLKRIGEMQPEITVHFVNLDSAGAVWREWSAEYLNFSALQTQMGVIPEAQLRSIDIAFVEFI